MSGKTRKPKSAYHDGWGIMTPYGDIWTPHIFDTKEQAKEHFDRFWQGYTGALDWSQYRVVWCRQRTTALALQEQP